MTLMCLTKLFCFIYLSIINAEHARSAAVGSCNYRHKAELKFQLIKACARSQQKVIDFDNSDTLEGCIQLAKQAQVIRTNAANKNARKNYWEELHEYFDCIVLECPENATFGGLIKDKRFNYYSLYDTQLTTLNYTCVPEVGLFHLITEPASFWNASRKCAKLTEYAGSLAYVTSEKRSDAFAKMLNEYNLWKPKMASSVFEAFVNLYYNTTYQMTHKLNGFRTTFNESINCFLYSAWESGFPQFNGKQENTSCVTITKNTTWKNIDCRKKLPFICEVYTLNATRNAFFYNLDRNFC